jgi:hypothetical protein
MSNEKPKPSAAGAAADIEKVPVDQVLAQLGVQADKGLSSAEAQKRLAHYGPNALIEKEESFAAKILGHFMGPIAYMIEAAALVSALIGHWDDFAIISFLLFLITRSEHWFFLRPFPAAPLFLAILFTQILAILMCAFGWLVEAISWTLIAWIWTYNIIWMFLLCAVRLITERFIDFRTALQKRSLAVINQSLQAGR